MSKKFENMLSGGHPNSLGRTLEVVEIVLEDAQYLDELFACYESTDPVVRLRVSSAFKRIFRQNNRWFVPYIDRFQHLVPQLKQPSAQWTLAQLHLEFHDLLTAKQRARAVQLTKDQVQECTDWIVLIQSMNFLEHIATEDAALRDWLIEKLKVKSNDTRKTVRKRAQQILTNLLA